MKRTNWVTQKFYQNKQFKLKNVTSFTLTNTGKSLVFFRERVLKPNEIFVLEGDGSFCDFELEIEFENQKGEVILDYRCLINNCL